MARHCGDSQYHDGSLRERTRKARRNRGQRIQARKDKAAYAARRNDERW